MERYLCIHGHFYQPPRENAWLEKIEIQPSAFPYHDWNERITRESYYPNAFSRVLNDQGKIIDIVNNYSKISFNFGPTVLSWMEQHAPTTYHAILDSDKESMDNFGGHGSAVAQVYNHLIMPLANRRDKETQIIWGIEDFKKRFNRMPEGMWLGEAAVDTETLELMSDQGIKYSLLAPRQAARYRKIGSKDWIEGIDPNKHYSYKLPNGNNIALFFYDGQRSQNVAFKGILQDGKRFAEDLMEGYHDTTEREFVHIATDGESYGHHHKNGDMALAYCLRYIEENDLTKLTNYGQYLEIFAPEYEVEIHENSSWSCEHGVERWRSNCGCHTGGEDKWNQKWREPLRTALDNARDQMIDIYEKGLSPFTKDPWAMRNDYIRIIMDRSKVNLNRFLKNHIEKPLSDSERTHVMRMLEMQRNAMLMFTSCGWFFNDISGIETLQILQYACRAIQLAESESNENIEEEFIADLARAESNVKSEGTGKDIYLKNIVPYQLSLTQVGMHYAVASLFADNPQSLTVLNYDCKSLFFERKSAGLQKLAYGTTVVNSKVTTSKKEFSFVVIYLGQHHLIGGTCKRLSKEEFEPISNALTNAFERSNVAEVVDIIKEKFRAHTFSFFGMFKDEQMKLVNQYLEQSEELAYDSYRKIYDRNYGILNVMKGQKLQIPPTLKQNIDDVINIEFKDLFTNGNFHIERMEELVDETIKWDVQLNNELISAKLNIKLDEMFDQFQKEHDHNLLAEILQTIKLYKRVDLNPILVNLQNSVFGLNREFLSGQKAPVDGNQIIVDTLGNIAIEIGIDLSFIKSQAVSA
ncbi:MAG: alpha-amylase/alpha-mannosidase (GH57 family) [Roseivirga sp.]|jgi:alpha-amylase/alpha-mannosidase (GH57 family)